MMLVSTMTGRGRMGYVNRILLVMGGMIVLAVGANAQSLAPAVALEAEEFQVEKGWKVIRTGQGNYTVDIIGFCHMGGERLLQADKDDTTAVAFKDIQVPEAGDYMLWARYEYPSFSETIFKVEVQQDGKTVAQKVMGRKENERLSFNDARLRPQYDPPWGPEGTAEEPMEVKGLKAGAARIRLLAQPQSGTPGVSANRNVDLIYMTRNTEPIMLEGKPNPASWWVQGGGAGMFYPILNVFRDSRGARWEVSVANKGSAPISITAGHVYNRVPWGAHETVVSKLEPGKTSDWVPLKKQDTTHFSMVSFNSPQPFELQLRPVGGSPVGTWISDAGAVRLYIPPYPGMGDNPRTPVEAINAVLDHLRKTPAPGKTPTVPLAYGGWMNMGQPGEYGSKYGELYKAIGMRAIPSTLQDKDVMAKTGLPLTKSAQAMLSTRQYPTADNISKAKATFEKNGLMGQLKFFDYGDEISFSEWMGPTLAGRKDQVPLLWKDWYGKRFPGKPLPAEKPNSSYQTSQSNPRLYVDSVMFYEELAMEWVAAGNRAVKAALGPDVLCGANYSAHPFYYPLVPMYVTWFRRGASDWGRHSEYFWQVCQSGPMVNGYIAEHFRAGMRDNPKAINRQYTMPHSPGNTEASFMRTAFSHLAHGAKLLDYFGIGMNECFTENHIDHRDADRYRQIRDVNYSMALVEDVWLDSQVVPSQAAILLSESTERWDMAGVAGDLASHSVFGENFRKIRLHYHLDRLGIWEALTFAGVSPDLVIEEDLRADRLKNYRLLVLVGDSIPSESVPALEQFVKSGGVILATASVGRFGAYREPNPALQELMGIASRTYEEKETFIRPLQEMQFLKPYGVVQGEKWEMPSLAVVERITPAKDVEVLAAFKDGGAPAVISRKIGKGQVIYVSALPGVAYLWSALQPPIVPDRGVNTHKVPEYFDSGAMALVQQVLTAAGIEPPIRIDGNLIDTRLVKSGKTYILPVANYNSTVGQDVTFSLKLDGKVAEVISAYRGKLKVAEEDGRTVFTLPALKYGDLVRINLK